MSQALSETRQIILGKYNFMIIFNEMYTVFLFDE